MTMHCRLGLVLLAGITASCSADMTEQQNENNPAVTAQSVSGTATFGEAAVAPVLVYQGTTTSISSRLNTNDVRIRALAVVGSYLYAGGEFSFRVADNIDPRFANLVRFQIPSTPSAALVLDQTFAPTIDRPVWAIAATSSKVYIGGEFTSVNGTQRRGLAALNTNGTLDTAFSADISGGVVYRCGNCAEGDTTCAACAGPPENAAYGVHALAMTGSQLVVGGNFAQIKGVARSSLASVSVTDGTVAPSYFSYGVNGFVHALLIRNDRVFVGGNFSATTNGIARSNLMLTSTYGTPWSNQFNGLDGLVHDLDYDNINTRLIVGAGGGVNGAVAFSADGGDPVWSTHVQGDVQAVKYFEGNVYFGFHDGIAINGSGNEPPIAGDEYKLAAVNANDGTPLHDKYHSSAMGCRWSADTWIYNCWAPRNNSEGQGYGPGEGGWGTWAIDAYTLNGKSRLIVASEVGSWYPPGGYYNGIDSRLLTTFGQ